MEKNMMNVANAANENENSVNNNVNTKGGKNDKKTKNVTKKHEVDPVDVVLSKARPTFESQLDHNAKMVKRCIERHLTGAANLTQERFLGEYLNRVCRLLDSKTFCRDCEDLGLDAYNAATHFVFTGMCNVYKILDRGLEEAFPNLFERLSEPVYTIEELMKVDTRKRLTFLLPSKKAA